MTDHKGLFERVGAFAAGDDDAFDVDDIAALLALAKRAAALEAALLPFSAAYDAFACDVTGPGLGGHEAVTDLMRKQVNHHHFETARQALNTEETK